MKTWLRQSNPMKTWLRRRGDDHPDGIFCFCPIDDGNILTGMMYVSDRPPKGEKCIGEYWYENCELKYELWEGAR
jgi:hypothetical protein